MSKEPKASTIQVEDRTDVVVEVAAPVESVTSEMGTTTIETFTGVQTNVNWAEAAPEAPASE